MKIHAGPTSVILSVAVLLLLAVPPAVAESAKTFDTFTVYWEMTFSPGPIATTPTGSNSPGALPIRGMRHSPFCRNGAIRPSSFCLFK